MLGERQKIARFSPGTSSRARERQGRVWRGAIGGPWDALPQRRPWSFPSPVLDFGRRRGGG